MNQGHIDRGPATYVVRNSNSHTIRITVRPGWLFETLQALNRHRATGCSFFDYPAPRLPSYIHHLRRAGFEIRTVREPHGGEHPGNYARYFLLSEVTRIADGAGA